MSGISIADSIVMGRKPKDPNADVIASINDLKTAITGDLGSISSSSPINLGREALRDIRRSKKQYAASEIPDLFQRYQQDVAYGRRTPAEAQAAYEAAAFGAGVTEGTVKKAGRLGAMQQGLPQAESYQKYRPFFDITSQQLLGRPMGDSEYNAYVGALQGMGITNPSDVASSFGKMLTTSDEYTNRLYRFKPAASPVTMNRMGTEMYNQMFG